MFFRVKRHTPAVALRTNRHLPFPLLKGKGFCLKMGESVFL